MSVKMDKELGISARIVQLSGVENGVSVCINMMVIGSRHLYIRIYEIFIFSPASHHGGKRFPK